MAVLPKLVAAYNASVHRMIGMSPQDVNSQNEHELWDSQQIDKVKKQKLLHIGDHVRISKAKGVFAKGYENSWSEEIFTITHVIRHRKPVVMYKLQDYDEEPIEGVFYAEEVQKVDKPETWQIEKVLQTKRDKKTGKILRLIKWKGYKQPTWTDSDVIKNNAAV